MKSSRRGGKERERGVSFVLGFVGCLLDHGVSYSTAHRRNQLHPAISSMSDLVTWRVGVLFEQLVGPRLLIIFHLPYEEENPKSTCFY